ncbi:MAG: alpha/beta hydrolase [Pseudomonadota bacterium]
MSSDLYHARVTEPKTGEPLVFALHGTGGDENQFFDLAAQLVPNGGVISPRGDVSEMGANRFFKRSAEGVYDMADLARATEKMAAFIEAHAARHPESPVYAFGYSNGANILASVFLARPDLFDRVALLHPLVTWEAEAKPEMRGRKVLVSAGERDPITPWPMSEKLISWLRKAGAEVSTAIHPGGHELQRSEIAALASLFAEAHVPAQ